MSYTFSLQVRPIFRAPYGATMHLLANELHSISASAICLLMSLREQDIRLDGRPRANATPSHPGVILTFNTPLGPRQFPCDKFDDWQDNLRAIALSLQSLRAVDRYGVTQRGEQYTGFAALPPPNGDHWTEEDALRFLDNLFGWMVPREKFKLAEIIRAAERRTHPDAGGNPDDFKNVQKARELLLGDKA